MKACVSWLRRRRKAKDSQALAEYARTLSFRERDALAARLLGEQDPQPS